MILAVEIELLMKYQKEILVFRKEVLWKQWNGVDIILEKKRKEGKERFEDKKISNE